MSFSLIVFLPVSLVRAAACTGSVTKSYVLPKAVLGCVLIVMFGISLSVLYLYYSHIKWEWVEISAFSHVAFESHMIVSLSLILYDTGLRLRCQQIVTHCNSQTTSLLRCDTSDTRFSLRLKRYIIARPIWGNCDLPTSYSRPQKFMLFFRVESVNLILLFLFSLLYVIYHRPSV